MKMSIFDVEIDIFVAKYQFLCRKNIFGTKTDGSEIRKRARLKIRAKIFSFGISVYKF